MSNMAIGVSPSFSVSSEPMSERKRQNFSSVQSSNDPNPPKLAEGGSHSLSMSQAMEWPHWVSHVEEPKFDGFGIYSGQPTNMPDFIREDHFISIMRCVDRLLAQKFEANILSESSSPRPQPPPR